MPTWKESAEQEGPQSLKAGAGHHYFTITKIIRVNKDGQPFKANDGSDKILLILTNQQNEEAMMSLTLSERAKWVTAKLLSRVGVELEELDNENVAITDLVHDGVAERYFLNRSCYAYVGPQVDRKTGEKKLDREGKPYMEVTPMHWHELPTDVQAKFDGGSTQTPAKANASMGVPDDNDIPF